MKKGKLNPDRYKVAGGAPVNQEDDKGQSPGSKTEQKQASNKSTESHSGKKVRGSVPGVLHCRTTFRCPKRRANGPVLRSLRTPGTTPPPCLLLKKLLALLAKNEPN